ncbi:MAG: putative ABC transporter permease [Sedimentibacter sp.]
MSFSELFLYFYCYSFLGWLYESTLCSLIGERRFINRGFLLGPYCPIYGMGVVLCWLVLKNSTNVFRVFGAAAVLCCSLEYITSFCMEKFFNARWWDYSNMPFQLQGRICLYGGVIFGAANVAVRFILQPVLMQLTVNIDHGLLFGVTMLLSGIMAADTVLTLISWKGLNKHLGLIHDAIYDKADGAFFGLTDRFWDTRISYIIEKGHVLLVRIQNLNIQLDRSELRFFQAFPNIRIHAYEEILQWLRIKDQLKKDLDLNKKSPNCLADNSSKDVLES